MFLAKIWKGIVSNRDLILVLLGGILAVWLVYRGVMYVFQLITEEPDLSGDIPEPMQHELSYDKPYYRGLADSIEEELGTLFIGFGVTPDVTYGVFDQMNTKEDLDQLVIAFGQRSNWWVLGDGRERNLIQWLHRRLSDSQREPIKQKFNQFNIPF